MAVKTTAAVKTPVSESLPGVDDKQHVLTPVPVTQADTGAVVPVLTGEDQSVTFWAIERNASLIVTLRNQDNRHYDHSIQFNSNCFSTNNPTLISAIRSNPAFNVRIFENEFPPDIRRRIDKQREGLTKDASAIGDTQSERYPV